MLHRIRLEIEDKKPLTFYKRLYDVTAHSRHARVGKPTHTARMRFAKQDLVVYLIDGKWVSYG